MDKKEIYEHLANIYLDASSSKKNRRKKKYSKIIGFSAAIFLVPALVVVGVLSSSRMASRNRLPSEIALIFSSDPAKINFNFNPAKKETYSIELNRLDLAKYKVLGFSARKINLKNNVALRIELTNVFKEKSEVYFTDIPYGWQDYRIDFAKFKNISDWSEMSGLSFTVEEWNTQEKNGVVLIDNVRVLR